MWRLHGRATWHCHLAHERRRREVVAFSDAQHLKVGKRSSHWWKAAWNMGKGARVSPRAGTRRSRSSFDYDVLVARMAEKTNREGVHALEVTFEINVKRVL